MLHRPKESHMATLAKTIAAAESAQRLGFSVWARSEPKSYLCEYGERAKNLLRSESRAISMIALVDDVLPQLTLGRSREQQREYNEKFLTMLPTLGFDDVHLISDFLDQNDFWSILKNGMGCSTSEFYKLLPQSKKGDIDNLKLDEVISFLWHVRVIEVSMELFDLSGFVAGIRSEYFYLTCRHLLKPFSVYFLATT